MKSVALVRLVEGKSLLRLLLIQRSWDSDPVAILLWEALVNTLVMDRNETSFELFFARFWIYCKPADLQP